MRQPISILLLLSVLAQSAFGQGYYYARSAAAAGYTANTAVFDGASDYMSLASAGPTGLADANTFTASFWVKLNANSVWHTIFDLSTSSPSLRVLLRVNNDGTFLVFGADSSGTEILRITTVETITVASGWVHVYTCIDLSNTSNRKIYFNGVACTLTVTTYNTAGTIDLVGGSYNYFLGSRVGLSDKLDGALSEFWFNDSYLDDTTKFASGGCPISLGSDGSTPTGSSPVFYFKGNGNGFNVNSGTGGDLTIDGSLGTTTAPCP